MLSTFLPYTSQMKIYSKLLSRITGIIILSLFTTRLFAVSECLYTEKNIDPAKLISSNVLHDKRWFLNDRTFYAKTRNGAELKVTYWACENYAVQAQLNITNKLNRDELAKQIIWMANYILSPEDVLVIEQSLPLSDTYPIFLYGDILKKLMINVTHDTNGLVLTVFGST